MSCSGPRRLLMLLPSLLLVGASATPSGAEPPSVVPRADWDPTPRTPHDATRYRGDLKQALTTLVVHHSDFDPPEGPQGILAWHLEVSGFSDIGYHYVIGTDGTVYEGRALDRMGAHAGQSLEANRAVKRARPRGRGAVDEARQLDPDYGAIGVVLDGRYDVARPSPAQETALFALLDELTARYDIAPERVIGHRDVKQRLVEDRGLTFTGPEKSCPGHGVVELLDRWRAEQARRAMRR